jgi:hemolysin III
LAGGLLYTLGTVFYLWRIMPYHHAVWHLFVLGGTICHYLCVQFYVMMR